MITLVLMTMLSFSFNTKAMLTQTSEIEDLDETLGETNENGHSRKADRNNKQGTLNYTANDGEVEKFSSLNSSNLIDWTEINRTNEWNKFAFSDGNLTRIIVGINSECDSYAELEGLVNKHDGYIVNTVSIRAQIIAAVVEISIHSASAFIQDAHVAEFTSYIEPDMKVQAQLVPNDPYWNMQWGPQKIEADWAWNTTLGDPSVLVAVVDTGIDYTHPDLVANYVALGYDWVNNDADPIDDHGHGTHCAGIIAALLNNSLGIAGLAQVRVMAEKVLDWSGWGDWSWVASGIINATDCGADIISMSIGGYYDSELVHEAVRYAYDAGVLLIAAAGNENTNMKLYPAGYDEVVAVAATDEYDNKAGFSNWGEWIELAAPGVNIYSTVPWGYEYAGGTSMATPHVSGVAALIWSRYPNKTRDWVRLWLRYTVDDLGDEGFDIYFGYGRVNARKAVEQTPPAHELIVCEWRTPLFVEPLATEVINATILNFGENNETDVAVQLLANDTIVDSTSIGFLASGNSATVNLLWNPTVEGLYNITLYVVPVPGETSLENNLVWKYIYVGSAVKAVVLHSAGNIIGEIITNWQVLNSEWYLFGDTMVYIDYTTLNKEDITYEDIVATGADVLIISCAYSPYSGWEFTDSEIEAIKRYVHEGHGLVATAGTLYYEVPNNNKLAPLFGLNETTMWSTTGTDLLHVLNATHPLFRNVPNPFVFTDITTAISYDWRWDSNELAGGTYLAKGHFEESAIVTYRGLLYISPWLEIIQPYYHHHLQLLYNAITWSRYQKPEHELVVSLETPTRVNPGETSLLNATVSNLGRNNETEVELQLLINGTLVDSVTIGELTVDSSYTFSYSWTPTTEGIYNITAFAPPVPSEEFTENNIAQKTVIVLTIVVGDVLVYTDDYYASPSLRYPILALDNLGITYTHYVDDPWGFGMALVSQPWDLVLVDHANYYALGNYWTELEAYVRNGGLLILSTFDIDGSSSEPTTLWDTLGVRWASDMYYPEPVYRWIPTHPMFTYPNSIGDLTSYMEGYSDDGDHVATTTGTAIAGFTTSLTDNYAAIVVGEEYHTVLFSFLLCEFRYDQDSDGKLDAIELWENAVVHVTRRYEHDLAVSLDSPVSLEMGNSTVLNATVRNRGLNNETSVELYLLINGTVVNSETNLELLAGESYTINYVWTPTRTGSYNITAYAPPVIGEEYIVNNVVTESASVFFYMRLYLPHEWVGSGAPMGWHADDGSWSYTLPFDFPFYGIEYRTIYISSNGLITFNSPDTHYSNSIPELARKLAIAAAWDDWETYTYPHDIYLWENSTHVGIRWEVAALYNSAIIANFEAILAEDGVIQLNYGYNNGPISATIGISNGESHILAEDATSLNNINTILFTPFPLEHELVVYLDAPTFIEPGDSALLNATVLNLGLSNETNVELLLLINGTTVYNVTIPELVSGAFYSLDHLWTPTIKATYNVTAYAPPVLGEKTISNNVVSSYVYVTLVPRILAYVEYTDYYQEYEHSLRAIDSTFGPTYILTELWDYTQLDSMLPGNDILLIPEQEYSSLSTMESIGATWSATLSSFMTNGGVIIVCDYSGGSYGILTGAGLMSISSINYVTGWVVRLVAPSDPLAEDVSEAFVAPNGAISFITNETTVVFRIASPGGPGPELDPIVIHKRIGSGHIALIGFDYYESNTDTDRILGNAIGLAVRPDHELVVSARAWPSFPLGTSTLLRATVYNFGLSNETNVELYLLINGSTVASKTISECPSDSVYALSFLWTPTVEGTYNVTAYAPPVPGEELTDNNIVRLTVSVFTVTGTYIHVSPPVSTITLGGIFTIDIGVVNVTDLAAWQIELHFDPTVLRCTATWYPPDHVFADKPYLEVEPDINNVDGYVLYGCTLLGTPTTFSGNGTLCKINFTSTDIGSSSLQFSIPYGEDTFLLDSRFETIPCMVINGVAELLPPEMPPFHDVAIISLMTSAAEVYVGQLVHITVVAANEGDFTETFNVTAYYNTNPIGTQTINLASVDFTIVTFTWNTIGIPLGNYTIKAVASPVLGEIDIEDNTFIDGTVGILWRRDVALIDISSSQTWAYEGWTVLFNVTVRNEGDLTENVTITLYYNITAGDIIDAGTIENLHPNDNTTISFMWDTRGVTPCFNYTIAAVAETGQPDSDPSDNTLIDGKVKIRILGDINGDGKVNIRDVAFVAMAFGSYPGHPRWSSELDLNKDGKINIRDIALVASNYGKCS